MTSYDVYRREIIEKFSRKISINSLEARELIKKLNFQKDAYLLSCIALTYRDEAMFNESGNMRAKFVKRKLNISKKYIDKAFKIRHQHTTLH